jgi:hypothetical protein
MDGIFHIVIPSILRTRYLVEESQLLLASKVFGNISQNKLFYISWQFVLLYKW